MEKINKCCNKEMIYLGKPQGMNGLDILKRYVCADCGSITDITSYALDDENLLNLIQDEPKLKDSRILKELKEGV